MSQVQRTPPAAVDTAAVDAAVVAYTRATKAAMQELAPLLDASARPVDCVTRALDRLARSAPGLDAALAHWAAAVRRVNAWLLRRKQRAEPIRACNTRVLEALHARADALEVLARALEAAEDGGSPAALLLEELRRMVFDLYENRMRAVLAHVGTAETQDGALHELVQHVRAAAVAACG